MKISRNSSLSLWKIKRSDFRSDFKSLSNTKEGNKQRKGDELTIKHTENNLKCQY